MKNLTKEDVEFLLSMLMEDRNNYAKDEDRYGQLTGIMEKLRSYFPEP